MISAIKKNNSITPPYKAGNIGETAAQATISKYVNPYALL
jgi:hypothetical protein